MMPSQWNCRYKGRDAFICMAREVEVPEDAILGPQDAILGIE